MIFFPNFNDSFLSYQNAEGLSIQEIENLEKDLGQKLPKAYVEFLQRMGKRIDFLSWLGYSIYDLNQIRGGAENVLFLNFREEGLRFLKEDDFVFMTDQGVGFFYFSLNEGDNPPVYAVSEIQYKLEPHFIASSFTEFIMNFCKWKNS